MSQLSYQDALALEDKSSVTELFAASGSVDSIAAFQNLRALNLSGNWSIDNFSFVKSLPKLERLHLDDMGLSTLPRELELLSELMTLSLRGNVIKDLSLLSQLPKLVALDLGKMELPRIPDAVLGLNLKVLRLYGNELKSITSLEKLTQLEEIHLGQNRISKLPKELAKLEKLRVLDISQESLLEDVSELRELTQLGELRFSNTHNIPTTPDDVFRLGKLKCLELHLNKACPDKLEAMANIGNLSALEELTITGSAMESLPADFGDLKKLRRLDLSGNERLADIDALKDLPDLAELLLPDCDLRKVGEGLASLKGLKILDLSRNRIQSLSGLRDLPKLEELRIYSGLKSLPDTLASLSGLRKLHLRANGAEVDFLCSLTALEELIIRDCVFERIPAQLKSLRKLGVHGSCAGDDSYLGDFSELEELHVEQEDLCLPPMASLKKLSLNRCSGTIDLHNFKSMPKLEELEWSRQDSLTALPQEIADAKALKRILLQFTKKLADVSALRDLPALTELEMSHVDSLNSLPEEMASLTALQCLTIRGERLENIDVVGQLKALTRLELRLKKLVELPDSLKNLQRLREVKLGHCKALKDISVLESVSSLELLECKSCAVSSARVKKVDSAITSRTRVAALKMSYQRFMQSGHFDSLKRQEDGKRSYDFPLHFAAPDSLLKAMQDFSWLDDHRDASDYTQERAILAGEDALVPLAILDFACEGCEDQSVDSYAEEIFLVDTESPQNPVFIWGHDGSPSQLHRNFDAFLDSLRDFTGRTKDHD